jgi:hypothetical protein
LVKVNRTVLFLARVAADCDPVRVASQQPDPGVPPFARGTTEFDRALGFFDATYAVALTLLVTTLDGYDVPGTWADPAALWAAIGTQVVAFFIAFAVVAFYWRSNHGFVGRLNHLSGHLVTVNIVLLAFIVLLPFSTDAMGQFPEPLATAVFAGNVAVISSMEAGDVRAGVAGRTDERSAVAPADAAQFGAPAHPRGGLPRVDPGGVPGLLPRRPAVVALAPNPQPDGRCPGQPPCHPAVTSGEGLLRL